MSENALLLEIVHSLKGSLRLSRKHGEGIPQKATEMGKTGSVEKQGGDS